MKRNTTARILVPMLGLSLLAGCGKTEPAVLDPDTAFAKHAATDVVMTVNGTDVTWSEFFYRLYNIAYQIQYYDKDGKMDWTASSTASPEQTNAEYVWQTAVDSCMQFHVLSTKAADLGITLDAADQETLDAQLSSDMTKFCGENPTDEAFDQALSKMYLTRDVYNYFNEVGIIYDKAFAQTCGTRGENLTDEDIQAFIDDEGYTTVKHILISTQTADGSTMTGEDLAGKTALATLILTQLQEVKDDPDALCAKFDELMNQYSEDTGLPYYPDGYTFKSGEMVEEFETAAQGLDEYGLSDLVQTDYGYHIILRLPTTRDSLVTYVDDSTGYTIGDYASASVFSRLLNSWIDEADVTWNKDFKNLTPEKIFK